MQWAWVKLAIRNQTSMSKRPTDDLEPSAKRGKRANDRQITKDDVSDDEDDEVPTQRLVQPEALCSDC